MQPPAAVKKPTPAPEPQIKVEVKEPVVESKPKMMFNIEMDDQDDESSEQSSDSSGRNDIDDDDHLFEDHTTDAAASNTPKVKDSSSVQMLEKRESRAVDNYDDDHLFDDDTESKPQKVVVKQTPQAAPTVQQGQSQGATNSFAANPVSKPAQKQSQEPVKLATVMDQRIDNAIQRQAIQRQDESIPRLAADTNNDEELNSEDDISDSGEEFDVGSNSLLGYYVKTKRKKDKRKIQFKNCVLRYNGVEYLLPNAKGEFLWAAQEGRRR